MLLTHRFILSKPFCRRIFTLPPVAPSATIVPYRTVLSVTGNDATKFLQGLITRNIEPRPKAGIYAAFLHAQGKVMHDVFIYPTDDGYLIDHDPRCENPLSVHLKKYVLRSKVRINDVRDEWDVWSLFGGDRHPLAKGWKWGGGGAVEPEWEEEDESVGALTAIDRRTPSMGKRLLVRKGEKPAAALSEHVEVDPQSYTLHRVMQGVPEGTVEIPWAAQTPFDVNMDVMGGIDFRKGCYVGQELVVRTYHRGVVRKRTFPLAIYKPPQKPPSTLMIDPENTPPPPNAVVLQVSRSAVRKESMEHDEETEPGKAELNRAKAHKRRDGQGKLLNAYENVGLAILRFLPTESPKAIEGEELFIGLDKSVLPDVSAWRAQAWRPDWWPTKDSSQADS